MHVFEEADKLLRFSAQWIEFGCSELPFLTPKSRAGHYRRQIPTPDIYQTSEQYSAGTDLRTIRDRASMNTTTRICDRDSL